jgi:hypothetical protein
LAAGAQKPLVYGLHVDDRGFSPNAVCVHEGDFRNDATTMNSDSNANGRVFWANRAAGTVQKYIHICFIDENLLSVPFKTFLTYFLECVADDSILRRVVLMLFNIICEFCILDTHPIFPRLYTFCR